MKMLTAKMTLLALLFPLALFSQSIGLKVGGNVSTMANNLGPVGGSMFAEKINWHAGLWGRIPMGSNWGIQPELQYIRKGAKNVPDDMQSFVNEVHFNFDYVELPVLAYVERGPLSFQLGAAVGTAIDHHFYDKTNDEKIASELLQEIWDPALDFSLLGGVALEWNKFRFALRYQHGLVATLKDIRLTDENGEVTDVQGGAQHRNLLLSVGYTLWEKK